MAPVLLGKTYARPSTPLKLLGQLQTSKVRIAISLSSSSFLAAMTGWNTIIPADDPTYYTLRPNIGIAKSALAKLNYGGIYFNPGLANGNKGGAFPKCSRTARWLHDSGHRL